jgi:hypothetical protein
LDVGGWVFLIGSGVQGANFFGEINQLERLQRRRQGETVPAPVSVELAYRVGTLLQSEPILATL